MKRFNSFMSLISKPINWDCWAGVYPLLNPIKGPDENGTPTVIFRHIRDDQVRQHRPAGVDLATWCSFCRRVNNSIDRGICLELDVWVSCGLCYHGPKCYAPSLDDWRTLARTPVNVPWRDFRPPYETFCVVIPDDAYDNTIREEFGFPAVVYGRYDAPAGLCSIVSHGDRVAQFGLVSCCPVRDLSSEVEEALGGRPISEQELPLNNSGEVFRPTPSEAEYFLEARRAWFNACVLMSTYGAKPMGPANPELHAKLTAKLNNPRLPANIHTANRRAVKAIPQLFAIEQFIRLREYRTETVDGSPTGRHVKPHWRRGHWANQRHGAGNKEVKRIFRAEVFVNAVQRADHKPAGVMYS